MSKNILLLSASPRKGGNSDTLCDQFMLGAQESGNKAEKIFLKDKNIAYCSGCGTCVSGGNGCSQDDDMKEVLDKMVRADVLVMATPVYFYTMNGQMKTVIDRTCSRYTEMRGKDFYFIMTAADTTEAAMEGTISEFRSFTACLDEANERGIIYGTGAWAVGDIKQGGAMKEAYKMGKAV